MLLILHAGAIAASQPGLKEGGVGVAADAAAPLTFTTSFVSLSPGHTIATSLFVFSNEKTFEIKIPDVDCQKTSGSYTSSGLLFEAHFAGTIRKGKKHYHYSFSAKGISLFDSYIAGTMVLDERINETGQHQKVTFVFWGTSEAAGTDEEKTLFPF